MTDDATADLLRQARGLLRFQSELGLSGLDVAQDALTRRPVSAGGAPGESLARQPDPAPEADAQPPKATAPGAAGSPAAVPLAVTDPAASLRTIRDDLGACERCKLHQGRTNIVFGVGNPSARLMFVGEGPGRDEDLQGEPFVGAAGQLLDKMIVAMGLERRAVYIANIVKCRPPRNRDPEADEVASCEPFLKRQIEVIQPEALVALGRYAAQTLLDDSTAVSRLRGHWREYEGIPLMPTFHPAYLLRNPQGKRAVWQDLQQVMARLGLEDPRRKG